ncbi:OB-fold domain-containing protein [Acidiferrimicrobium sp. IK]|uniref:Zn-ribbon domain-containing OB-fold protein n=1 Tax=Acidiferrimicrobium sp. IK TaxID=2871700 RepID=UPI0021CB0C48|nr:OB-fold domain-containing protein [Acidiferrimicrobium sp. IK]MCU4183884.1 OB-fold domain-containing protein [Acidiferrimicrobium sp. IK]
MSTTAPVTGPKPSPDEDSAHYWQQLNEHRIALQACTACHRRRFPSTPACPYCAEPLSRWEQADGTGTVFSYIVVHRAFDPAFAAEIPYTVATVDLDGGGRLVGRLTSPPAIGARVQAQFVGHTGWTELRFADLETS